MEVSETITTDRGYRFRRLYMPEIEALVSRYAVWCGDRFRKSAKARKLDNDEFVAMIDQVHDRALRLSAIYDYADTPAGARDIAETASMDGTLPDDIPPPDLHEGVMFALWAPSPKGRAGSSPLPPGSGSANTAGDTESTPASSPSPTTLTSAVS